MNQNATAQQNIQSDKNSNKQTNRWLSLQQSQTTQIFLHEIEQSKTLKSNDTENEEIKHTLRTREIPWVFKSSEREALS